MSFFKKIFSKSKKTSDNENKMPNVSDVYGVMPKDSLFEKMAEVIERDDRKEFEKTYSGEIKFDQSKISDDGKPNYGGLVALYCYRLSLKIVDDFILLTTVNTPSTKFDGARRIKLLSANCAFFQIASLKLAAFFNSEDEARNYLNKVKLGLIENYFLLNREDIATDGVDIAKKSQDYFNFVNNDKREDTVKCLEEISNWFIAMIQFNYEDQEKFNQGIKYGKKLYSVLEEPLINSNL